ncbi:MAG: 6-phosphogluconolactonase [Actinomycetota bacterium]|jgi:6-phosphogluconolactonase/glucosamine-6-phosphate isomerase/deaminase|nr:6-phosphogluconolactonase [Actinomycetota bacterium]
MENLHICITEDIPNEFSNQVLEFSRRSSAAWSFFTSGGSLAPKLYESLASHTSFTTQAKMISFYLGDERVVDPDTDASNTFNLKRSLIARLGEKGVTVPVFAPFTSTQFHALAKTFSGKLSSDYRQCDTVAKEYAAKIKAAPRPWLVHLGMGPDGHTASLFARSPAISPDRQTQELYLANYDPSGTNPYCRLTLSLQAISRAELVIITTSGKDKAQAVKGLLESDLSLPVSWVRAKRINLIIDHEAASSAV